MTRSPATVVWRNSTLRSSLWVTAVMSM
jgi:hypothetical protein